MSEDLGGYLGALALLCLCLALGAFIPKLTERWRR